MKDIDVVVYDIETPKEMFLIVIYDPESRQYFRFEISRRKNQINKFIRFVERYDDVFWVGFNNIRFDAQVVEWILRNYEKWGEKSGEEIAEMIYQKAQDVIDDSNYNVFPEYREEQLSLKQLDLFTIWHFNNENRRTSLKAVEFSINFENIEESSIPFNKIGMTDKDMEDMIHYCVNDVNATYQLYLITRGQTELPLYKGKDKLADRHLMEEEFELKCLNWDDVKIGAEWNKIDYMKLTKKSEKELKPEKVRHFYGKRFRQFFPKTVRFQTPELKKFVRELGNTFVLNKKQEFKYKFNDELTATIGKGGIHSNEYGRFLKPKEDEIYLDADIGSQYPNAIRKYKVEPKHLPGWNNLIVSKIERRLENKRLFKETGNPKYASLQEMGKLSLNGGSYGRLNTKGDWQQDPCCMLQVTMGGQLELLMIVEDLILKDFNVVSLNTDGFGTILKRNREKEFKVILSGWEKAIGNDTLGQFEYTEFKWIAQTSVNDYLALKADGSLKMKGDFEIDKELHKNSSMRIVPIALKEYFVNNVPVKETVANHDNIYDFCIRRKSSKHFHYEGLNLQTGETSIYNKLIRYYVSNTGEKIYKIKNPECDTNAPAKSQVEAGEWLCTVCNYLPKTTKVEDCDIDFGYYIDKVERIIAKINRKYKREKLKDKNQLSLW